MGTAKSFEELKVWQMSRDFCKDIFRITSYELFSKEFRFRDQLRASSGSIMDNIAEGFERGGNKEFIQFLYIAKGSCGETRSQLYRSLDFGYITNEHFHFLKEKVMQIIQAISGFINYLKQSELKGNKYKSDNPNQS